MKVKHLAHLVEIWKLFEKDPATKSIYLHKGGAQVAGMHVGAARKAKLPLVRGISVDGAMLSGTLDLFPADAKISIKQTKASLILTAGDQRAVLSMYVTTPPKERLYFDQDAIDSTPLRAALPFLQACTSGGVVTPILTGIHFMGQMLEATDAEQRSGRLRLASLPKASNQVVPAGDLEKALSLLSTKFAMRFSRGHLRLRDKRTAIKIALLNGKYPDLSNLPKRDTYKHHIKLDKAQLDTVLRAAVLLDSDRLVTFVIKDGTALWRVHSQETGGFRQVIGPTKLPDVEIIFDAHWLDAAQYVGRKITLRYNDGRSPVLFTGNKRLLWMSPVIG